jgi:peptidoglycan/xylan/chitin deacetylase (PgdA/CDA1 family)
VRASGTSAAINQAVRLCACDGILLVAAGCRLDARAVGSCVESLGADETTVVAAPSVRMQTADGSRSRLRTFPDLGPATLFEDATGVPPVLVLRRNAWDQIGGLDASCGVLALCDLLLRLHDVGRSAGMPDVFASCDVADDWGWSRIWSPADGYLHSLAYLVDKHRAALEAELKEVLIRREIGFGTLREAHRELVRRRDADLQRLDAMRAEAAHARAYLLHHGMGGFDWGDFRRTDPISRDWGYDRGVPIDRHYIDDFLASHSSDIRGAVLEVQEDDFTAKFGGPRVHTSVVADLDESNTRATHLADLRCAPHLASDSFDCIILTQTLHVIDDVGAVLSECRRLLRPGGVLLATLPCASRVCLEYGADGDLWRMTPAGGRVLFEKVFGPGAVDSRTYGNVLANVAFLEGVACAELNEEELDSVDPYFPALVGLSARKEGVHDRRPRRAVLMYHRVDEDDDVHGLAVSPERFDDQLALLARDCRVLPLDELLRTPAAELPPRAVALTFDDGYLDNLERVAPALERAGLPATFFLTSRWLDGPGEYWWDTLERVILRNSSLPPAIQFLSGPDRLTMGAATAEERLAAHARLHAIMVHAALDLREQLVRELARLDAPPPHRRPLVADEVQQLSRVPGASIGAHSVNHLALPDQTAAVMAREIEDCRATLQRVTGCEVEHFAYPYGAVTRTCADAVRPVFRWACACDDVGVGSSFDAARVARVEVRNWTADQLSQRLAQVFAASAR